MAAHCHFAECAECVNRLCDPFRCHSCVEGSHFEPENTEEELTVHELIDLLREPQ